MSSESFIPLAVPQIAGREWEYVKECLDSGWVSSVGAFVERFEREFAATVGARHAIATVNGTAALHVALRLAGVAAEDEVLVSGLTFVAPANAVRYLGAWPVFMDAEPAHWQMDVAKVRDFLRTECAARSGRLVNRTTGRRIAALLPVHILGHPVDLEPLLELAHHYSLPVVEDATESLAATYDGRAAGTFGLLGCFSFNGNKLITTGGGGMIVTNDSDVAARARYLTTQAKDDPIEFVHNDIGYNYRMPNILAAVGVAQLEQLDAFAGRKRTIFQRYRDELSGIDGISFPHESRRAHSCWWLSTARFDPAKGLDRRAIAAALRAADIDSRPLWHPLHALRPFRECQAYRIDVTPAIHRGALSLPCSTGLTDDEQDRVIDAIRRAPGARRTSSADRVLLEDA